MKYVLFYFIASSHQFILLQPSVQLQHFHARLAGGRDLQLSITLACCYQSTWAKRGRRPIFRSPLKPTFVTPALRSAHAPLQSHALNILFICIHR